MGKCLSRSKGPATEEEKTNESKEETKNNNVDATQKNEATVNGQVDVNRDDDITETEKQPSLNPGSSEDAKTPESSLNENKAISNKEAKTVRIMETKACEEKVEVQKTEDVVQITKTDDVQVDFNDPEVQKAATTIQAGFRGHQTRKQLKSSPEKNEASADVLDVDPNDLEANKAAVKIQANYRGHLTRKNLQEK